MLERLQINEFAGLHLPAFNAHTGIRALTCPMYMRATDCTNPDDSRVPIRARDALWSLSGLKFCEIQSREEEKHADSQDFFLDRVEHLQEDRRLDHRGR